MASIDQLRMSNKLDSLLPQPATPALTPAPGKIAHNDVPPAPLPASAAQ
jgi:hypothetical protein